MKNAGISKKIKKLLTVITLLCGILFGSSAFAMPPQIVLFCSSWNMKCREAKKVYSSVAFELGIKFTELDIDQNSSQQKADDLGVNFPSSVPYVYLLDNSGNVVPEELYKGESSQDLKQKIITALNRK